MTTKIFSLLIIVWTITCIEICTGCKNESPEEITITPSTNNSIQTLLSEEVLALLDAQQIQQLPSFKFRARHKEHPEIQSRIEMSLIPETLSNSFTAYLQLFVLLLVLRLLVVLPLDFKDVPRLLVLLE